MIDRLHSGGLITNYSCSAACKHCLYKSSPQRDKSFIEPDMLRSLLKKAASLGCSSFHIGGGEPMLNREGLYKVLEIMREEGVSVDYLETNASWFRDAESAQSIIKELTRRGCGTIMVSVCPFHNEFIPLVKMEGVIQACQETDTPFFIWQEQYYRHLAALDREKTHSFEELEEIWGGNYLLKAGKRFGLTMNGRALETYKPFLPRLSAEDLIEQHPRGCSELEKTNHFHLDLEGNFIPPGCVGLTVDHEDLGAPLSRDSYPHYLALREEGVKGLLGLARDKGYEVKPAGYASKCDLCEDMRRFLLNEGINDNIRDLGPAEYYYS